MMACRCLFYCLFLVTSSFFISQTTPSIQLTSSVSSSDTIPTAGSNLTLKFNLFNNNPNASDVGNATVYGTVNGIASNLPMAYYVTEAAVISPLMPQSFADGTFIEIYSSTFNVQFTATFRVGSDVNQGRLITFTLSANYTDEGKA